MSEPSPIENYANMKWWQGFYTGWISGIGYYSILYIIFTLKNAK